MARSRSRSRGRTDTEVRPFRKGKKGTSSPKTKKLPTLTYKVDEAIMARWPGSRLYYTARVISLSPDTGEYEVEFENGITFTLTPKDVYKEPTVKKKRIRASKNAEEEDHEDITSLLSKADSFKEPSKAKNGSRASKSQFDAFSDDEELLSVSQRPSVSSSMFSRSRTSTLSPKLDRASFSSTINRLLDGVFTQPAEVTNGIPEKNEAEGHQDVTNVSESVDDQVSVNISEEANRNDDNNEATKERGSKSSKISKSSKTREDKMPSQSQSDSSRLEEFSDDELGDMKPSANQKTERRSASLDWLISLFFMILSPVILLSLHNFAASQSSPLPLYPSLEHLDIDAFLLVTSFLLSLFFYEFVCIGKVVEGSRMNGFQTLVLNLLAVPGLLAHGVSLAPVTDKYGLLMTSSILLSLLLASVVYYMARFTRDSRQEFTNPLSDLYHGLALHPRLPSVLGGAALKLQLFRFSMVGLAVLNLALVAQSLLETGSANIGVIVTATLQIFYCMDAMWYESYYFYSADYLNSGTGLSLICSYLTFPFLPSLITRTMIGIKPEVGNITLAVAVIINILGYIIYRSSESARCELAKDPDSEVDGVQTEQGVGGRKMIVSGWCRLVRHPNYTGEIMVQWSWVLPLLCTVGLRSLAPLYLPVVTTLMLIVRCEQTNIKNRRKYGRAWEDYSRRVTANIIPYVY